MNFLQCLKETTKKLQPLPNSANQAKWLICHTLNISTTDLLLNLGTVSQNDQQTLENHIQKLLSGYPLAYIIGSTQFMGLDFYTCENVLIPRNDTETLVSTVISHIQDKPLSVLDLCTGSGCIGISISHYCKNAKVTLADISPFAIDLATKNATLHHSKVSIITSDLFTNINQKFDCIVSNPPYIPTSTIKTLSKQVQNEPFLALDGKEDGLYFYKQIQQQYKDYLNPNGSIFLEIGNDQGKTVASYFPNSKVLQDLQKNDRVVISKGAI